MRSSIYVPYMDGIYVIRSSVPAERLPGTEVVSAYKDLAHVEQAFRSIKTVDLEVRPVHHRLADRVRAHLLICMLAYYVAWHLQRAWAPLTFKDEDPPTRVDPVAKAERSAGATAKARTGRTAEGLPARTFGEILEALGEAPPKRGAGRRRRSGRGAHHAHGGSAQGLAVTRLHTPWSRCTAP